jgi:hypothetical protein
MQETEIEMAAIFGELREMIAACGPDANKGDVVHILIIACIEVGMNTRARIVGALRTLGFNYAHVNIILNNETGLYRSWQRSDDGSYTINA